VGMNEGRENWMEGRKEVKGRKEGKKKERKGARRRE